MHAEGDYQLFVESDGDRLRIAIAGDVGAASHHVHEVRLAAEKLGIAVDVEPAGERWCDTSPPTSQTPVTEPRLARRD